MPLVVETLPAGLGETRKHTIDFGGDFEVLEPVSRSFSVTVGEEAELEGWAIEYRWPERPSKQ